MTKTSLYIIAAFIGSSLFSCADLDRLPINEVASENGWKNNDDAVKAVNKLYTCAPEWDGEGIVGLTDEAINSDDAVHGIKWAEAIWLKECTTHKTLAGRVIMKQYAMRTLLFSIRLI